MNGVLLSGHIRQSARRGFVFIIALGAMAVLLIVAATANLASVRGYQQTGQAQRRAQLDAIAQSCLETIISDGTSLTPGNVFFEMQGETDEEWTIIAGVDELSEANRDYQPIETLEPGHYVYLQKGLAYQSGDVRLTLKILIKEPLGQAQIYKLSYFWNLNGRLTQPLFLFRGV